MAQRVERLCPRHLKPGALQNPTSHVLSAFKGSCCVVVAAMIAPWLGGGGTGVEGKNEWALSSTNVDVDVALIGCPTHSGQGHELRSKYLRTLWHKRSRLPCFIVRQEASTVERRTSRGLESADAASSRAAKPLLPLRARLGACRQEKRRSTSG